MTGGARHLSDVAAAGGYAGEGYPYPINASATVEKITPEKARRYRDCPPAKRGVTAKVREMASMMGGGLWDFNGESIKFVDGALIDGEKRLDAIIASGCAEHMVVVRGLTAGAEASVDQQTVRTLENTMRLRDIESPRYISGAVLWLYRHETQRMHLGVRPPTALAFEILDENPGLRNCVDVASRVSEAVGIRPPLGILLYYLCSRRSSTDADFFFCTLEDGEATNKLGPEHPIRVIRGQLLANRDAEPAKRRSQSEIAEIVVRAWNAYRTGESRKSFSARCRGGATGAFPEVV